jgi:hypothetical protein
VSNACACLPQPRESEAWCAFNVPGETVVPRGYYMLFALDNNDMPSVAKWAKVVL